jgi:5-deoxy-glucuronate isomerase
MVIFSGKEKLARIELTKQLYSIDTSGKEVVVVLLSGAFRVGDDDFSRESVFLDPAQGFSASNTGIYNLEVEEYAEICVIENESKYYTHAIDPLSFAHIENTVPLVKIDTSASKIKNVGHDNFLRKVTTLVDKETGLERLIVGETIKQKGNWSSWPPHKHDTYTPEEESEQREVYMYKFDNPSGFGIQVLYDQDIEDSKVQIVTNNREVKIEKGYHPVVSSPHSAMYYLWALFGDNSFFRAREDMVYAK